MDERNVGLDMLKVLATFSVLKLHAGYNGFASEIIHYICGLAVPIFFMVSGALTLNRSGGVDKKYAISRSARVLCLMFIWNVPFVFLNILRNWTFVNPIKYMFAALFQRGYLWHFWYLWALVFMYVLSPIMSRIIFDDKFRKCLTCILIGICFVLSLCTVFLSLGGFRTIEELVPQALRIWSHVTYFWLGACVFRWLKNKKIMISRYHLYGLAVYTISVAVVEFLICTKILKLHSPENLFTSPIIIVLACLIFIVGCSVCWSRRLDKIIEHLIGLSLGMYIVHPFIILLMKHFYLWKDSMWVLNFAVLTGGAIIVTAIVKKIPYLRRIVTL